MRVLLAPDGFTGTLTASQAAEAMAEGWSRWAPDDVLEACPLADGGPGFVDALHRVLGGDLVPLTVTSPTGAPVPATMLLVHDAAPDAHGPATGPTAYVESGQAAGLALVPEAQRDPTRTSSRGVGELVRAALDAGARRIVVGLGGTGTNDGGAGMFSALGVGTGVLSRGGGALGDVDVTDLAGLVELRRDLAGVDLVAAADVDVALLGLHGASAGFAEQKGATPEQAQDLERCLGAFAHAVQRVVDEAPLIKDLFSLTPAQPEGAAGTAAQSFVTAPADGSHGGDSHEHGHSHSHGHSHHGARSGRVRLASLPGAGAGGGLGFGLAALGARVVPGSRVVADAVGLAARVRDCDVVLTGEGTFDWQSMRGKVVSAVADVGLAAGVPVVVLAGQAVVGRREWSAAGFSGVYAVATGAEQIAAATADPYGTLAARTAVLARTWSPRRP